MTPLPNVVRRLLQKWKRWDGHVAGLQPTSSTVVTKANGIVYVINQDLELTIISIVLVSLSITNGNRFCHQQLLEEGRYSSHIQKLRPPLFPLPHSFHHPVKIPSDLDIPDQTKIHETLQTEHVKNSIFLWLDTMDLKEVIEPYINHNTSDTRVCVIA